MKRDVKLSGKNQGQKLKTLMPSGSKTVTHT